MDDLQDVLGLEDLVGTDGQLPLPRRSPGRQRKVADGGEVDPHAPTTSWWLGVSPDRFANAAAAEQERMQQSAFGKKRGLLSQDVFS